MVAWMVPRFQGKALGDTPGFTPAIAERYLFATGNWQYWNMFAPPPGGGWKYSSVWIEATVKMWDGSRRHFKFPRPSWPDGTIATVQSASLKYQHRILEPQNKSIRTDLANYLVRQVAESGQQPASVSLSYCTISLPKPSLEPNKNGEKKENVDYTKLLRDLPAINRRVFYLQEVATEENY